MTITHGPWYTYQTDNQRILIVRMDGSPSDDFREVQKQVLYPPVAVIIGDNKDDASLVAAAPDLLVALYDEIKYMRSNGLEPAERTLKVISEACNEYKEDNEVIE